MRRRDELASPDSCLNRASDDEPLFVLRANDPLAPIVVRIWAEMYAVEKTARSEFTPRRQRKSEEAYACALQMETWREDR